MKVDFRKEIILYYNNNLWSFHTALFFLLAGIIAGAFITSFYKSQDLAFLHDLLANYSNNAGAYDYSINNLSFKFTGLVFLLIVASGFFTFGYILTFFLFLLYGVTLGFSVGLFVLLEGIPGLLLAVALVLPHNLIIIPALTFLIVASASFSYNRNIKYRTEYSAYLATVLTFAAPMILGLLVKWTITPVFVYWATNLL